MTRESFDVSEGVEALINFLGCALTRILAMFSVQHATESPTPRRLSALSLLSS